MTLQRGRSKRNVSCSCTCCTSGQETPIPRYFFKEHCYAFDEITLFIEFYVAGICLYIRVLSESPPFLERFSELASDHAHYFSLNDDEQTHYMAMVGRWVFLDKHESTHNLRAVGTHE